MTWRRILLGSGLAGLLLAGCHGDTDQGGAPDRGHAGTSASRPTQQRQPAVPNPPTADQIDPNSPQAVLDGTSTTNNGKVLKPTPQPPPQNRNPE